MYTGDPESMLKSEYQVSWAIICCECERLIMIHHICRWRSGRRP